MVSHKEFESAGKQPGLQIWRIENMDLKPVPKPLHGSFFTGDSYIVLQTTAAPSYNIHMWLGNECSQDESGAAAIFATQLDDHLGGGPVQFREVQGNESLTFLGYFKSGIKYKMGGVASGFKHVVTNDANVKRLLHIKGRRIIRATEVGLSWGSFNKGDCFIIDLGKDIYQWCGSECNRFERLKASQVAIDIRNNERNGRAKITMVEEDAEPEEIIAVSGNAVLSRRTSPFITVRLRCSLGLSLTPLPAPPLFSLDQCSLTIREALFPVLHAVSICRMLSFCKDLTGGDPLLNTAPPGRHGIFGQDTGVTPLLFSRNALGFLMTTESQDLGFTSHPKDGAFLQRVVCVLLGTGVTRFPLSPPACHLQIQVIPSGAETALFKQFFSDWRDKDETTGPSKAYTIGRIAKVEQIPFDIWRVEGGDKVAVDPSTYGQFFGGDCYLILYSYRAGSREQHIIYTWQGQKSTQDELAASAFLTVKLDDSMGGSPVQVRVTQGQEPAHLLSLFKGKPLVIHSGGTSRKGGQTAAPGKRLFHIRQSSTKATRAVEVKACASSLNTNDVFVLKAPDATYVWRGVGATEEEVAAAKHVVAMLKGSASEVSEGKEPAGFWAALGGKKEYQTSRSLQKAVTPPRLFGCSNKTGRLIAEEVPGDFTQADLATDDVMLLDAGDQIFLWIGNEANEVEKTGAPKIAKEYMDSDPSGRRGIPVTTVKQGHEPPTFTGWFMAWDSNMWDTDPLDRIRARF
ncbi:ADSV protein, partial [Atractosteus spatula]|nr:ADSV protein [Atractosteus spatula]